MPELEGPDRTRREEQIRQFMYAPNSPMLLDDQRLNNFINRDNKLRNKLNDLEKAVNDLIVNHPGSPARAPVLEDMDKPPRFRMCSSRAIRAIAGRRHRAIS